MSNSGFFSKTIEAKDLKPGQWFKRFNDIQNFRAEVVGENNGLITVFTDVQVTQRFKPQEVILIRE